MLKLRTACTTEIDDVALAVDDILAQIGKNGALCKNSVGIFSCYFEFLENGFVTALCKRLPFDVIGNTVMGSATNDKAGLEMFSLAVLTSDDVNFSTVFSSSIDADNVEQCIADAYGTARSKLTSAPAFMLALAPTMKNLSGAVILEQLDLASHGVPTFGSLSNDSVLTMEHARTVWNGEIHSTKLALLLVEGAVTPRFFISSISARNIFQYRAKITDAEKCIIKHVNDLTAREYFLSLGLNEDDLHSVPILVDYADGTRPIAAHVYGTTEEGYALCGAETPIGSTLMIGKMDYHGVLSTAEEVLEQALSETDIHGILMFPCYSRILVLSPRAEDEMEKIRTLVGTIPFWLSYSGGEMCPVSNKDHTFNRFHNLSYVLCVF
jgi:hypothetical protein